MSELGSSIIGLIPLPPPDEAGQRNAATRIQSLFRGWKARKRDAATRIQLNFRIWLARKRLRERRALPAVQHAIQSSRDPKQSTASPQNQDEASELRAQGQQVYQPSVQPQLEEIENSLADPNLMSAENQDEADSGMHDQNEQELQAQWEEIQTLLDPNQNTDSPENQDEADSGMHDQNEQELQAQWEEIQTLLDPNQNTDSPENQDEVSESVMHAQHEQESPVLPSSVQPQWNEIERLLDPNHIADREIQDDLEASESNMHVQNAQECMTLQDSMEDQNTESKQETTTLTPSNETEGNCEEWRNTIQNKVSQQRNLAKASGLDGKDAEHVRSIRTAMRRNAENMLVQGFDPETAAFLSPNNLPNEQTPYIMFHGTSWQNAALIEQNGFMQSRTGLLGVGVYLSRDIRKAKQYAGSHGVVLAVVAKLGKVCKIQDHPGKTLTWHDKGFDSAWVDRDCPEHVFKGGHAHLGIVEEDCVWDPARIAVVNRVVWDTPDPEIAGSTWYFEEDKENVGRQNNVVDERWVPFSRYNSLYLESHWRAYVDKGGHRSVKITVEEERKLFRKQFGFDYSVDFQAMRQTNLETAHPRSVKRILLNAPRSGCAGSGNLQDAPAPALGDEEAEEPSFCCGFLTPLLSRFLDFSGASCKVAFMQ